MRLFHFSDAGDIDTFVPRPVATPAVRAAGREWLNGPLVWAIDEWHQPMYLFPRDCPRILFWPVATTTPEDARVHWAGGSHRMVACIEWRWFRRLCDAVLYRYALPEHGFHNLEDAGMWVSPDTVVPAHVLRIDDLPAALAAAADVELRVMPDLEPLLALGNTSLHVSGIRLRNMGRSPVSA